MRNCKCHLVGLMLLFLIICTILCTLYIYDNMLPHYSQEEEKDEFDFDPELREDGFLVDHNYLSDGEGMKVEGRTVFDKASMLNGAQSLHAELFFRIAFGFSSPLVSHGCHGTCK